MPAYPWGGHRNGYIPESALRQLRAEPGDFMRADAAAAFDAMAAAFRAHFGYGIVVLEAYRSYVTQKNLRDLYLTGRGNIAATPGTSVHGWGLAVDLASGINTFGTPQYNWMKANATRFGFDNDRGIIDREAWHWEYGNKSAPIFAGDSIVTIENDMPLTNADVQKVALAVITAEFADKEGKTVRLLDVLNRTDRTARDVQIAVDTIPDRVWTKGIPHPLAVDEKGKTAIIQAQDYLRYEPSEHENTRRVVQQAANELSDKDVERIATVVAAKMTAPVIDVEAIAARVVEAIEGITFKAGS